MKLFDLHLRGKAQEKEINLWGSVQPFADILFSVHV